MTTAGELKPGTRFRVLGENRCAGPQIRIAERPCEPPGTARSLDLGSSKVILWHADRPVDVLPDTNTFEEAYRRLAWRLGMECPAFEDGVPRSLEMKRAITRSFYEGICYTANVPAPADLNVTTVIHAIRNPPKPLTLGDLLPGTKFRFVKKCDAEALEPPEGEWLACRRGPGVIQRAWETKIVSLTEGEIYYHLSTNPVEVIS